MKVLIIDDDPVTSRAISLALKAAGHHADATDQGEDGLQIAKLYAYDAIVLDLGLPDMDGYRVLRQMREQEVKTPVLVLTGSDDMEKAVRCLNGGADDYLTKPFRREELLARLNAILRRASGQADAVIKVGCLHVDLNRKEALVASNGQVLTTLDLTPKEYELLEIFALNKGRALAKPHIYDLFYDSDDGPIAKVIDVYISKIRKKLKEANCHPNCIETIWGRGYRLVDAKPLTA